MKAVIFTLLLAFCNQQVFGYSSLLFPHVATNQIINRDSTGVDLENVAPLLPLRSYSSVHPAPYVTPLKNPIVYSSSYPSTAHVQTNAIRYAHNTPVITKVETAPALPVPVVKSQPIAPAINPQPIVPVVKSQPSVSVLKSQPIVPVVKSQPIVPVVEPQPIVPAVTTADLKPMVKAAIPPVAPVNSPVISQFHAQDELGQYSYGHSGGPSSKVETKNALGVVQGGFSYVDPVGIIQSQNYIADGAGFRTAGTNIPTISRKKRSLSGTFTYTHPQVTSLRTYSGLPTSVALPHTSHYPVVRSLLPVSHGVPGYVVRGYIANYAQRFI